MRVNLSEVMAVVGQTKHTQVPIELTQVSLCGEVYDICEKSEASLTLTCTGERKISIECDAHVVVVVSCSRCLKDVEVPFEINFKKEFNFSEYREQDVEELKEVEYIEEYDLNVDTLILEEILLQFPMQTLCSDDCKGICGICGVNLNQKSCKCNEQGRDPRMLAIQDIFKNFGQTD